jgi:hypothetical protein
MCSDRDVETRHVPESLHGTLNATRTSRLDLLELSDDELFGKCLVEDFRLAAGGAQYHEFQRVSRQGHNIICS